MFPGIGTVINVIAIIIGSFVGKLGGNLLPERTRTLITDVLGAVTLLGAASALMALWDEEMGSLPSGSPILIILGALLLGGLIGSAVQLEKRLEDWGESLKRRLARDSDSGFVEGFVTASLIFVIGPLAILGSISDGMSTGIEQLILKSTLDFFAAMAFAATFGLGVALSALPVGLYQGAWTISGIFLGELLNELQIAAMTATGGVLLFGIALKLLKVRQMAIGDLLPALAIAPLLATLFG
ncbi:MAG: hypothetical protein RJB30_377 [Actinomycetota bacterium]